MQNIIFNKDEKNKKVTVKCGKNNNKKILKYKNNNLKNKNKIITKTKT